MSTCPSRHFPDRCQADEPGARETGQARQQARRRSASVLLAPRQGTRQPTPRLARIAMTALMLYDYARPAVIPASPRAMSSSNVSPENESGQSIMTEHPRIAFAPEVLA